MAKGRHLFIYKDKIFLLDDWVHGPDRYSLFLEENISIDRDDIALDLVTGSGFHAIMMAEKASKVVGVDINPHCVKCAKRNVLLNGLEDIVEIRCGDLFEAIEPEEKFDLIVAWPPVFPTPTGRERNDWFGIATEGGEDGRKITDRIIRGAARFLRQNGRLQILHAWYNNIPKSIEMLRALGFRVEITAETYFPVGQLSYERAAYLEKIGFPLIERNGELVQYHAVVTAWWR